MRPVVCADYVCCSAMARAARYRPESNDNRRFNKSTVRNMMNRYEAPPTGTGMMSGYDFHDAPRYVDLSSIGIIMAAATIQDAIYNHFTM